MPPLRRHRRGGLGDAGSALWLLLFLGEHLARLERWPPLTLALVGGMVALFLQPDALPAVPPVRYACLQPYRVLEKLELSRLAFAPFLHADETHLGYNMASLLWKGSQLEPRLGALRFMALLVELTLTSQLCSVGLAWALARCHPLAALPYHSCSVGFSGVLFALKAVLSADSPRFEHIAGIGRVPAKWACWVELAAIQLFVPRASFLGHLGGILAGLLHVHCTRRLLRWRRAAAFAEQPRFAGGAAGSRQRQPRQLSRLAWAAAAAALLAGLLAATKPSEEGFLSLATQHQLGGFARNTGFAATSAAWVRRLLARGVTVRDLGLLRWGTFRSLHAVGLLGVWLPLPLAELRAAAAAAAAPAAAASRQLQALLQPAFPGVGPAAQAALLLNAALLLVWRSAAAGLLPPAWPLRHLEAAASNSRRPWAFAAAPFSHESAAAAAANSLELLCLAGSVLGRLGPWRGFALYALLGAAGHLAAVLLRGALRRARLSMGHSKGAGPALSGLLCWYLVGGLAGTLPGRPGRLGAAWLCRHALPLAALARRVLRRRELASQLGCGLGAALALGATPAARAAAAALLRAVL